MLSDRMVNALNAQITKELYSSYLYLQMAAWFDGKSLDGMGRWMKVQAQEEISHGMILYNYVNERGGFAELGAIDKPESEFDSVTDVWGRVLAHEQLVTASIGSLMDLAVEERDYSTQNRLEWFVGEQVEEESNASAILGKLDLIGESNGIFMLDRELGTRVFALPSPLAGGG